MKKIIRKIKFTPKAIFLIVGLVITLFLLPIAIFIVQQRQNIDSRAQIAVTWPTEPPARICGNASILTGPSTPPAGAVVVPEGDVSVSVITNGRYRGLLRSRKSCCIPEASERHDAKASRILGPDGKVDSVFQTPLIPCPTYRQTKSNRLRREVDDGASIMFVDRDAEVAASIKPPLR